MAGHRKFQDNGQLNGLHERVSEAGVFDYFLNNKLLFTLTPSTGVVEANVTGNLVTGAVTRKVVEVAVTASQLRTARATPIELVPGVAETLIIFQGGLLSTEITTAFDAVADGDDLAIRLEDGSGPVVSAALDTTTDIDFGDTGSGAAWLPPLATVVAGINAGAGLYLHNVGAGELANTDVDADGNATTTCTVAYLEIPV